MFAGQRAAEIEHQREHALQTALGCMHLPRIFGIDQQIDVDVAIAGVAEIDNGDAKLLRQGLQPANQRGNIRYRYNDVFIDLLRRDVAQRWRQRLARRPQARSMHCAGPSTSIMSIAPACSGSWAWE